MRPSGFPLIASLLLLWLAGCAANSTLTSGEYRISGDVRGAGGRALPTAQIVLTRLEDKVSQPLSTASALSDGRFSLVVPGPGDYNLWLFALGYPVKRLYIQMDPAKPVMSLQATLEPYQYLESIEAPKIAGSWSGKSGIYKVEPMQARPDGTWVFECAVEGDSVTYELHGLTIDGRSIHGPQADSYQLNNRGGYRSWIRTQDGRVRIVFDPRELPRYTDALPFGATFAPPYASLNRVNVLVSRISRMETLLVIASRQHAEAQVEWDFDYGTLPLELMDFVRDSQQPPVMRQLMAIEFLGLRDYDISKHYKDGQGEALIAEILQVLPTDSSGWMLAPHLVEKLVSLMNKPDGHRLLTEFAELNPEESVRVHALSQLLGSAHGEKNEALVASLSERLKPYAKNHWVARSALHRYKWGPKEQMETALMGKPVPAFSAPLMAGHHIVSRESLLGRFYLINFWASQCDSCEPELPYLNDAAERFKGRGRFTILSVSLDASEDLVWDFRRGEWKMRWMHVFAGPSPQAAFPAAFHLQFIPFSVLVDAQGNVVAAGDALLGEHLEKTLDALLPARAP